MSDLRLFIWEGDGISSAYHDDDTLVVLAHDADEARSLMRTMRKEIKASKDKWVAERDRLIKASAVAPAVFWQTPEGKAHLASLTELNPWDGEDASIDRKPDRIVKLDKPKWVAFNGGGYD